MKKIITTLAVIVSIHLASGRLEAGSSSTSGPNSPTTGAQQPATPSAQTGANTPPAGITNGTLSIESTILAYKVLVADATKINHSLSTKTRGKIVVVGTSTDIAAIVQWRIVLSQASILKQRLETLTTALRAINKPTYAHAPKKAPVKLGAGFIAGPADVATLIQTLGSITAVNETLSTASGALNDATLISLIAQGIQGASVYIPSVYPPHLMTYSDLSSTLIGEILTQLEAARRDAIAESTGYLQALQDAQIVVTTGKVGNIFTDQEIDAAGALAEKATSINALANAVTLASTAVDGFETSLFTGQGYSPSNAGQPNNPAQTPSQPAPAAPALPAPVPAPPLAPVVPPQNPAQQSQGQTQQPATPSGTTLQQILAADLLLHDIISDPDKLHRLQLLSVHALESGGGQLTKSNLFLGSRIYFSGGAVASFSLYDADGTRECSGVGYGYKGYIREKDIESVLSDETPAPATVSTDCNLTR
jgi:hypothetical protein